MGHCTPIVTLEVCEVIGQGASGIAVLVSRAGSAEVLERFWPTVQGRPDDDTMRSLLAVCTVIVGAAVEGWTGIQEVLPM